MKASSLSEQTGIRLLTAAAQIAPCPDRVTHASEELISALWNKAITAYAPVIDKHFGAYPGEAKASALEVLADIPADAGLGTLFALINRYKFGPEMTILPRTIFALSENSAAAKLPFAEIFPAVPEGELKGDLQSLLLEHAVRGWLDSDRAASLNTHLLERLRAGLANLRPFQREEGIAWMYVDDYYLPRLDVGELIHLIGYLARPESKADLLQR